MLRPRTISTSYAAYPITLAPNVPLGLADNKNHPAPPRPSKELTDLLTQLADAVQLMKTGLKAATPPRDYLRAQTGAAFRDLSAYAAGATPARPDLGAQANFSLTKADTSPRQTSRPVGGPARADGPGPRTLLATVDAQAGMYAHARRIFP